MTRSGQATNPSLRRFQKRNRPPPGEAFICITREMLESDSWRAMPLYARKIVERIMLEHMAHAGRENGGLKITYAQFAAYGVRRAAVKSAISIAEELGWIDTVERGIRAYGSARRPSRYGLTWLLRSDWTPASNRWRNLTREEARAVVARHRGGRSCKQPTERKRDRPRADAAA
jgi:hypothetical protein